jgi:hypothetical protein
MAWFKASVRSSGKMYDMTTTPNQNQNHMHSKYKTCMLTQGHENEREGLRGRNKQDLSNKPVLGSQFQLTHTWFILGVWWHFINISGSYFWVMNVVWAMVQFDLSLTENIRVCNESSRTQNTITDVGTSSMMGRSTFQSTRVEVPEWAIPWPMDWLWWSA